MKKNTICLNLVWIICFFLSSISFTHAQYINPRSNPSPIIPSGEPLEFTLLLTPGNNPQSYLMVYAPQDWTVTGSNPAGEISEDGNTSKIPFTDITGDTEISVWLKPGCDIAVDGQVRYEFYSSGGTLLATGNSPGISNIKYPVFLFTPPAEVTVPACSETYMEWEVVQNEADAYLMGGDLTINVVSEPGYYNDTYIPYARILAVEILTNNGWEEIDATIAADQLSYSYTFTSEDFSKIGSTDTLLTPTDVLKVREKIWYEHCYNGTPNREAKLVYTPEHRCSQAKINTGEAYVKFTRPFPNTMFTQLSYTAPDGPDTPGKFIIKMTNPNSVTAHNITHTFYLDSSVQYALKGHDVYFSDEYGNRDAAAPPISHSEGGTAIIPQLIIDYTSTVPYKGLQAADEDGICNDLVPSSEDIYVTVEWSPDFSLSGNCTTSNGHFFSASIIRITSYSWPGCSEINNVTSNISGERLGFNGWLGYIEEPNLIYYPEDGYGTQTTLSITVSPSYSSYPNGTMLKNASQASHQIKMVIPGDLKYVPAEGVTINNTPVAAADITYEEATNTLLFYNRDPSSMTSDLTYSFTVEAGPGTATGKEVALSHIFNWGNEAYSYGCSDVPITYMVRVAEDCNYIKATDYRVERTTLGFKNKNFETFSSLQEAREAGANLSLAGPNDNVEFEINATVIGEEVDKDTEPLYAFVSYMNGQGASRPYFSKGEGAVLQYQQPGGAWSDTIFIPADDLVLLYENSIHYLQVNLLPYLKAEGVSLAENTKVKVTFFSRTTEYLPVQQTAVNLLQLGIYRENRNIWDCNAHVDNFFVWDYSLTTKTNSAGEKQVWQNGKEGYKTGIMLKLSMNNGIAGLTTEPFPNEFRPNGMISGFVWNGAGTGITYWTIDIDRMYDSEGREFYEGTDYTVTHQPTGTIVTFHEGLNAYTGEYYNEADDTSAGEEGVHTYYIFAELRGVCITTSTTVCSITDLYITKYPTSENPTRSSRYSVNLYPFSHSRWYITTTTTASSHTSSDGTFNWPLTLNNGSQWAYASNPDGPDYKMPYTYLMLEVSEGEIEEFELYRVTAGQEVKVDAPFEEYAGRPGYRSYWIKIGEIEGEYAANANSTADFLLKGKQQDCRINNIVHLNAKFAVSSISYPDDPYTGFSQYNYTNCFQDYPTLSLSGTFYMMDFSGTVDESAGMDADGKFVLCEPAPFAVTFQNNLYAPAGDLQLKVARDAASALVLEDPATSISYTQDGVTYPYDDTWLIDDSQESFILIKLPASVQLAPRDEAGDNIVVNFTISPLCDFLFGLPVYMDVIGTSMCELTEQKNVATGNIRLSGYDENDNPQSQLTSFSMEKAKDNSTGPVYSYLEEADGTFKLKGVFTYQTTKSNVEGQATLRLPENMELLPGGVNRFERTGGSGSGGATSSFVYSRNLYRANFNNTEDNPTAYEFELDVRIVNPQAWNCGTYNIEIGSVVNIEMFCDPADPEPCKLDYSTLSTLYTFTLEKYNLELLADSVQFTEYYDYEANAGRLKINASVKNNGVHDMQGAECYLYKDANQNGVYDEEDTQLLSAPLFTLDLVSGDQADLEIIIETLSADETCHLMLVMPCQSGINRFLCDSAFVKKEVTYELATTQYRMCQGSALAIGDPAIGNYGYTWSTPGSGQFSDPADPQTTYTYPLDASLNGGMQTQTLKLTLDRDPAATAGCTPQELYVQVYIDPARSEWTGIAGSNWEDTENWNNGIPGKCTYVTIPEQADHYPVLDLPLTDENAARCDTIEFMHGAEVARTHLLDYNAAKVNLTLDPDRWNMLASPLRYMYTGDYYVNGYNPNASAWGRTPHVYWMYYRMANPQNEKYYNATYYWSMPFNLLEEPMQTGKGLVV
ncbi:MAG: hypothetical protein LUG18_09875 [Candidatus Azobacteroides sp.]|nr:hypothetical protein [Candidatus Azobacteroides sp.]